MKIDILHNRTITSFDVGTEDLFVIQVDGKDFVSIDPFYSTGEYTDPTGIDVPKVICGWWPDGDEWERLAEKSLIDKEGLLKLEKELRPEQD